MQMASRIDTTRIEAIADPVCRAHGVDLVQVALASEHGHAVLRVTIDRPGSETGPGLGVTLADCQAVSRDLGSALDEHDDAIPGHYRLEVSSPGLDRPLVKLADFDRFKGREVRVQTRTALFSPGRPDGRKNFRGLLVGVDGENVRIEVDGTEVTFPHAEIAKANVVHRFD